jgi:putative addiction module antidote
MLKSKITQIGNSVGLVLPKELLEKLNVAKGDTIVFTESEQGYMISPYDPEVEADMQIARNLAKRYRHTLRELAQ